MEMKKVSQDAPQPSIEDSNARSKDVAWVESGKCRHTAASSLEVAVVETVGAILTLKCSSADQ